MTVTPLTVEAGRSCVAFEFEPCGGRPAGGPRRRITSLRKRACRAAARHMRSMLTCFRWIARAEGASLLALMGIAMPVKYGLGEPLLVEWFGWIHGLLFLLYVAVLGMCTLRLGWSPTRAAAGFVASLLPGGTFVFEWKMLAEDTGAAD